MRSEKVTTLPGKKDDPNYAAVRGHVPKELQLRFKMWCLEKGVDNSQGLEDLLQEYFEMKDQQQSEQRAPEPSTGAKGKGK